MIKSGKKAWLALPLSAVFVLSACSGNEEGTTLLDNENDNGADQSETEASNQSDPSAEPSESVLNLEGDVVATVNGEDIPMANLEMQLQQYEMMFAQQGIDFEDEENMALLMQIQEGIVDELIQLELLVQEADSQNIQADEDEVQAEMEQIRSQFDDDFEEVLASQGYTEDLLENEIRDSLKLNQLLSPEYIETLDFEVTDEELEEAYEQQAAQNPEIGPFEDLRDDLELQVVQSKYLEQLYEDADIEILI
ncbi:SurA N-terminal domain-containing protein [Salisediminibacterium selenitireducens]|uniref:SurA domain protein n=1 Tax=Bacillus selenitireducens (strain ATCC 700615 / DSM 15326 / MLS10) TaxID=439292 RepID=D6XVD7_BACIE|nr:SurA N-terminal domain-containing protein [Salisediminibacterium selenitireducens]ADH99675.1 hypothetical protein Bsel_2171 [[Bacillus] selenitireducens MLS10]